MQQNLVDSVGLFCMMYVFQVVASLQAQLEQRQREAEQRDLLFRNLSQETENLKNQLVTVSARCQSLEPQAVVGSELSGCSLYLETLAVPLTLVSSTQPNQESVLQ